MNQQDAATALRPSLVKALRRRSSRASHCDALRTWSKAWGARRMEHGVGATHADADVHTSSEGPSKRPEEGGESPRTTSTTRTSVESTGSAHDSTDKQQAGDSEAQTRPRALSSVQGRADTEQDQAVEGIDVQLLQCVVVPKENGVNSPRLVRQKLPRDAQFRLERLAQLDLRKAVPSFEYQAAPGVEGEYQGDTTRRLVSMFAI